MNTDIIIDSGTVDESLAEEVMRNLKVLYGTRVGEQALDRDFGLDLNNADEPQADSQEPMSAEYIRKTAMYEPRARVLNIEWVADESKQGSLKPKVVIEIVTD